MNPSSPEPTKSAGLEEEDQKPKIKMMSPREVSTVSTAETAEKAVRYYYDFPSYYRWAMLAFVTILIMLAGPPYMNWPPLQEMFDKSGAYNDLCTAASADFRRGANGVVYCAAKDTEIKKLVSFGVSVMFCFTFVAGILLDSLGSKICTSVGLVSQMIGWVFIAASGVAFNGFKAGVFFLAAGADPTLFGLLSASNLFPGYTSTVISVLGAARSLAFAIPKLMQVVFENTEATLRAIVLAWCGVLACCLISVVLFVPMQSFPKLPPGERYDDEPGDAKLSLRAELRRRPRFSMADGLSSAKTQFFQWLAHAKSWGYLIFLVIPPIQIIRNNYYSASYEQHIPSAIDFYTIMNPLSFLPCPIMGLIADKVSAAVCICTLAVSGIISLIFGMLESEACDYISVIFQWIFVSFVASQFYCYASAVYPQQQMGKLVGFALLVGGVVGLVAGNMYEFAQRGSEQLLAMDLLTVVSQILFFLVLCAA